MTHSTSTDRDEFQPNLATETIERISLQNDRWLPHRELAIPIDDAGFRQGVIAVERLRTYRRRVFCIEAHLTRWRSTLESLGIDDSPCEQVLTENIKTLLERNHAWVDKAGDVGITMVATPGSGVRRGPDGPASTFVLHLNPLDHDEIQRRRDCGQPLAISQVTQPSPSCWPRKIKVRSRIHYYLADRDAR